MLILKKKENRNLKTKDKKENKIIKYFKKFVHFLDRMLFPDDIKCIFCGKDVPNFYEKPYCDECEKEISFNDKRKCLICAEPIDNEALVCDRCQKNKRAFKKAYCPFVYDGCLRKAILGYKDSNYRYLAKTFAKYIAEEIKKDDLEINYITYVPLTNKKLKKRSFDQSKLLAVELGKILELPVVCLFKKERDGGVQKNLDYKQRQKNMIGMYSLLPNKFKKTDIVLIVDDVITTCATINYCSNLIASKVKDVYVCAVARNKLKNR